MAVMVGMMLSVKKSLDHFTRLSTDLESRINPILTRVNRILEDSEGRISSVMGDTAEITRLARSQAQKVDRIFTDTIERLQIQVIRADQILTGAMEVVDEAGTKFRNTLWRPIRGGFSGHERHQGWLRYAAPTAQGNVVEADVASPGEKGIHLNTTSSRTSPLRTQ